MTPLRARKFKLPSAAKAAQWAGIAALPISIFFGFLSYNATWDVAVVSGALDKPIVTLGLGGIRLRPTTTTSILFGAPQLDENQTVTIGSIPFTVANEGTRTVDTPTVIFRLPKFLHRKALEAMSFGVSGSTAAFADAHRSLTSDETFDYSSYQIKSLDPKIGLTVNEPFYASQTQREFQVPVTTKDNKHALVSLKMLFSVQWLVTISGRDVDPTNYTADVAAISAASPDDLLQFAEQNYIPNQIRDLRAKLGFWQYLAGLIFRREERSIFLVYQTSEVHKVDGDKSLLTPASEPQVGRVLYRGLSWGYLVD